MNPDFYRSDFTAENAGNLVILHLLVSREYEQLAPVLWKLEHRVSQQLLLLLLFHCLIYQWDRSLHFGNLLPAKQLRTMLLEVIVSSVPRDMKYPGPEAAVVAVCSPVLQHPNKNLLNEIFSYGAIARHAHEKLKESSVVTVE